MRKTISLFAVLIIALLFVGVSYAMWSKTLYISGDISTGNLLYAFKLGTLSIKDPFDPATIDWNSEHNFASIYMVDKNVGYGAGVFVDTDADGYYDTLSLTIANVYPKYHNKISFYVENVGTIPLKIDRVKIDSLEITSSGIVDLDITGDGKADLQIYWGNNFGVQLHPGHMFELSFMIRFTQNAPQGETHTFNIRIIAEQWNAP